jgi:hypothetical protein
MCKYSGGCAGDKDDLCRNLNKTDSFDADCDNLWGELGVCDVSSLSWLVSFRLESFGCWRTDHPPPHGGFAAIKYSSALISARLGWRGKSSIATPCRSMASLLLVRVVHVFGVSVLTFSPQVALHHKYIARGIFPLAVSRGAGGDV